MNKWIAHAAHDIVRQYRGHVNPRNFNDGALRGDKVHLPLNITILNRKMLRLKQLEKLVFFILLMTHGDKDYVTGCKSSLQLNYRLDLKYQGLMAFNNICQLPRVS